MEALITTAPLRQLSRPRATLSRGSTSSCTQPAALAALALAAVEAAPLPPPTAWLCGGSELGAISGISSPSSRRICASVALIGCCGCGCCACCGGGSSATSA